MLPLRPRAELETHRVTNHSEPRETMDLWAGDLVLREAVVREGGAAHEPALAAFGAQLGRPETLEDARLAQRNPPELAAFDRFGRRIDEVRFHPAYHAMMRRGAQAGYASRAWTRDSLGGHVAHAALVHMLSQVEPGVCCPLTMTYASVPALRAEPALAARWTPGALAADYDPASRPATEKRALTFGMAMTEKQGGSDVRANETVARPDGEGWRLRGHKWFCSAPMSDAHLMLAQAPAGLTCFRVPRWTPDGARNAVEIQRLKDKLGDRANASAEIEIRDAWAERVGPPGEGVRTIVEMVHHTRLDASVAPVGLMRRALAEALWWCEGRAAFGRRLIDQPLMRVVLADLAVEVEAATALVFRVARAFDEAERDPAARAFARLAVALAKLRINKRCAWVVGEAMECLGGVGYVEESPMPMLWRQAPLNGIWEGSGNVIALDIRRTLAKAPAAGEALRTELEAARGGDRRLDAALDAFDFRPPEEAAARRFASRRAPAPGRASRPPRAAPDRRRLLREPPRIRRRRRRRRRVRERRRRSGGRPGFSHGLRAFRRRITRASWSPRAAAYPSGRRCMRHGTIGLAVLALALATTAAAQEAEPEARYSAMLFGGQLTDDSWEEISTQPWSLHFRDSQFVGFALSTRLARLPLDIELELEGQIVRHFGIQDHWEANGPIATLRWTRFPWDETLDSSLAFGLGPSFTTDTPDLERRQRESTEHVLAYWTIELAAGPPEGDWEAVARIHHRSVSFGLFGDDGGSNGVAFGLRRWF